MRLALALVLALIALPALAQQQRTQPRSSTTEAVRTEAENYTIACFQANESERTMCERARESFIADYLRARAGEYQGQRNVAFLLGGGGRLWLEGGRTAPFPVTTNQIQSCAWRLVVLNSGHARVGDGDQQDLRTSCAPLDEAGRRAAAVRAEALIRQITTDPVRDPPPRQRPTPRPGAALDGEARPLTADPPRR